MLKNTTSEESYLLDRDNPADADYARRVAKEKKRLKKIAAELCYGANIMSKLDNAQTFSQLNRVMITARSANW